MNDISYNNWNAMSDDRIAMQIGEFVKHHRMQQNKTQEMLAKDAGVSRSTLSLLEKGEKVTVATLIQVLRVLDKLQVMDNFTITRQQSPLLLAREERNKRQRVVLRKNTKGNTNNEDVNW